jgi:hypothetical protein
MARICTVREFPNKSPFIKSVLVGVRPQQRPEGKIQQGDDGTEEGDVGFIQAAAQHALCTMFQARMCFLCSHPGVWVLLTLLLCACWDGNRGEARGRARVEAGRQDRGSGLLLGQEDGGREWRRGDRQSSRVQTGPKSCRDCRPAHAFPRAVLHASGAGPQLLGAGRRQVCL